MNFLFEVMKDLVINQEYIHILFKVIAKVVKTKIREAVPVPEIPGPDADGNEPSEEAKAAALKLIEEANKTNADVEKFNEDVQRMQSKIKLASRSALPDGHIPEVGVLRLNNYREARPEDINNSMGDLNNS